MTLPLNTQQVARSTSVPTWAEVTAEFNRALMNEALSILFDRTPKEGALRTLFLAQMPDDPHEIAYILVAPEGLSESQWTHLTAEADSLWLDMENARENDDLADFSIAAREAFEQNVDGLACYLAALRGWDVRPVNTLAWMRKVVPA